MERLDISKNTLNIINQNRIITACIQNFDFIKAYNLIKALESLDDQKRFLNQLICNCFENYNIKKSKTLIEEFIQGYPLQNKDEIINFYKTKLNFYAAREKFESIIKQYKFQEADRIFASENSKLKKQDYDNIKSKYICQYFKDEHNISINEEQAIALSKTANNILVKARAGSGKTRTIACKAIFAIEKENLNPEEILILAFNKAAAKEIKERIVTNFNYKKFNPDFARTFNSFAQRIVGTTDKEILYDDSNKYSTHKLTNFIEKLYHSDGIWNEEFKNQLYYFYKSNDELTFDDEFWKFRTPEEKYEYLRHKTYYTLNGEKVKSFGEKCIANFLFEHNIKYKYEQLLMQKNYKSYKPDFTIFHDNKKYILEHWGIDENDISKKVPKEWNKTWDKYHDEMEWKRNLIQTKIQKGDIENFIETSIVEFYNGETFFENFLKSSLEDVGIACNKLPHEKIIKKMEDSHKFDKMAKKFADFILVAKKSRITPDEIDRRLKTINLSERSKIFIRLANKIYKKYDKQLNIENKTDFDKIMEEAIATVHKTKGNCDIIFNDKHYKINNLKLIMIDEYQDFSLLFFELIQAIRKYNPAVKLFCVGDDWQAINGFAGSNLNYFNNFTEIFQDSEIADLTYNYRSGAGVVNRGNEIMKNCGIPAKCRNKKIKSEVKEENINEIKWNTITDREFMYDNYNSNFFDIHHKYLKKCYEIIMRNPNKSYIIMHRTHSLNHYYKLDEFKNSLENLLIKNNIFTTIKAGTIHKFKGLEADNVIILEKTEWYPFIHPDNEFYFILDRTPQMVLDEEKRLLYVAVTRARENIYFLLTKLD